MIGGVILIIAVVLYSALKEGDSNAQGIAIAGIAVGIISVIISLTSGNSDSANSSYMFGQFIGSFVIIAFIGFLIYCFTSKK